MPHIHYPLGPEGPTLSVLVGLEGKEMAEQIAAGQPVTPPCLVPALIDTGCNVTCVAPRVLARLGVKPHEQHETQTAAGGVLVHTYRVSLGIPGREFKGPSLLILERLLVAELPRPLDAIEVLLGRDVLQHLLLFWDGPRTEFTLAD